MKNKLSDLLNKIFLSSIASIVTNSTAAATATPTIDNSYTDNAKRGFSILPKKDLSPKLLLKQNTRSEWTVVSHRSHRSHSSHRSHYSSTSGSSSSRSTTSRSSGSSSSTTSKPLGISSSGSSSNSSTAPRTLTPSKPSNTIGISPTTLRFGDRNLKLGMSGSDVTELINILIKKGYLKVESGDSKVYGTYNYDETIEATVKKYQKDNNLISDGTCGPATTYHLLNK